MIDFIILGAVVALVILGVISHLKRKKDKKKLAATNHLR